LKQFRPCGWILPKCTTKNRSHHLSVLVDAATPLAGVVFEKFWFGAGGKRPPPLTAAEFVERARSELKAPSMIYYEENTKRQKITKREYEKTT